VWAEPALTDLNVPPGGEAWPLLSAPQQATLPLFFTPQVWSPPALTDPNFPPGGEAWPLPS
jgi:hypothetical protein